MRNVQRQGRDRQSAQVSRKPVPAVAIDALEDRRLFTVYYVDSVSDAVTGRDGVLTLREALTAAATNAVYGNAPAGSPGLDIIRFNIPGSGLKTIRPLSALPTIPEGEPVTIDGFTQPGSQPNTSTAGLNAVMGIEINGSYAGSSTHGLTVEAMNTTIRGLVINGFGGDGLHISTRSFDYELPYNSGQAKILGNYIGTNATGTAAVPNGGIGVNIVDFNYNPGASGHTIGTAAAADRNLISGNGNHGVYISLNNGSNHIENNLIGTNAAGTAAIRNLGSGIVTNTTTTVINNLISGNLTSGIEFGEQGFSVATGNTIGTNLAGTAAVPNDGFGILVTPLSDQLTIGGTTSALRNLISGNGAAGILFDGSSSGGAFHKVIGNYIGVNRSGTAALANEGEGIAIYTGHRIRVGGSLAGERNVISGNLSIGVSLNDSTECTVAGNYIGTNASGTAAIGNRSVGIKLGYGSTYNVIGGSSAAHGNVIGGNSRSGIQIITEVDSFVVTRHNVVRNNFVGTNANATLNLGNQQAGISIRDSHSNEIGGYASTGNVVRFNNKGIVVEGQYSLFNYITYNRVWSNQQIQIDLGDNGKTYNDAYDIDGGPNGLQNTAVLTIAKTNSINGYIYSTPNATIYVQLYQSVSTGANGLGEAEVLIGTVGVILDANGYGTFRVPDPNLIAGRYLTAIATASDGTSEISSPMLITA